MSQVKEYLPFSKALRISDALGRYKRELNNITGSGTGESSYIAKECEIVAVDQSGSDGIYTVRASDLIDSFAVGDKFSYIDVSEKGIYSETLTVKSINRTTWQITADGKFTAAPLTTDILTLFATKLGTAASALENDYILDLNVSDQVNDLLAASMSISNNVKNNNAIHPLIKDLVNALNSHYPSGLDKHLDNHTDTVISTPTNTTNATLDIPDDEAKWFVAADYVTYYDTSLGYRSLEKLAVTSVGAAGSGTTSGTTLITLTGTWSTPPIAGDYLLIYDRLCPEFKYVCDQIGLSLTAARVFPEETNLGTYAATGASAGTFTDGSAVDTTDYGGSELEIEVINQAIGANNLVLAITGKYYNAAGTETTDTGLSCTVTALAAVGTRFAVTVGTANARYHDVTAITNSNGTNGDDIKIVTKKDRLIRRS